MKFNKKMVVTLCSITIIVLIIIVVLMLFTTGKKVLSYTEIENRIISAGQNYYFEHKDELPETGTTSIDTSTLVSKGYLNDLSRYTKEGVTCSGTLFVTKNPINYSYRAQLNCGSSYTTIKFKDLLMDNLTIDGNGLYEDVQINPDNNSTHKVYVFKGDNVNNYIKMGDYYWRIIKIHENGEIAVLGDPNLLRNYWDNRFNIEIKNYKGINEYEVSRIKDYIIDNVVENDTGYKIIKSLITTHNACVGKRGLNETSRDGSVECSKVLENQYFSLLPIYDYMNASLDKNCNTALDNSCYNYNYLSSGNDEWWTGTAVDGSSQDVYYIDRTVEYGYASQVFGARLYAHLDANVTYVSGTGTYEDPYILK